MKTLIAIALAAAFTGACENDTYTASPEDFVGTWTWLPDNVENITCGMATPVDVGPMGSFTITASGDTLSLDGGPGCTISLTIDSGGQSASAGASASCATDPVGATAVTYPQVPEEQGSSGGPTPGYSIALGNNAGAPSGVLSVFMNGVGTFMGATGCTILSGDVFNIGTIAMTAGNKAALGNNE
jgi:hypothetical protein